MRWCGAGEVMGEGEVVWGRRGEGEGEAPQQLALFTQRHEGLVPE